MVYINDTEMYPAITPRRHMPKTKLEFFMKNFLNNVARFATDERVIAALGVLILTVLESKSRID